MKYRKVRKHITIHKRSRRAKRRKIFDSEQKCSVRILRFKKFQNIRRKEPFIPSMEHGRCTRMCTIIHVLFNLVVNLLGCMASAIPFFFLGFHLILSYSAKSNELPSNSDWIPVDLNLFRGNTYIDEIFERTHTHTPTSNATE